MTEAERRMISESLLAMGNFVQQAQITIVALLQRVDQLERAERARQEREAR